MEYVAIAASASFSVYPLYAAYPALFRVPSMTYQTRKSRPFWRSPNAVGDDDPEARVLVEAHQTVGVNKSEKSGEIPPIFLLDLWKKELFEVLIGNGLRVWTGTKVFNALITRPIRGIYDIPPVWLFGTLESGRLAVIGRDKKL